MLTIAILFLLLMLAWALAPSLFTAGNPSATNPLASLAGLSARFPLGADQYGRSVYTELVYGAKVALEIGFFCTILGGGVGGAIGIFSGYLGGKVDMMVMRGIDMLMALPPLFLALIFIAALAPTTTNEIIAVSVATVPAFARVMRGRALEVRSRLFIDALTVVGVRRRRILWRHVVPNCAPPALVLASINVGTAIVTAASLNFLGLGPSVVTSWGTQISSGQGYINKEWWISVFPGILITLLVISVNIVGDWVRDALEPSSQ
jgi:peptide/nickel transport system permease protein